MTDSKKRPTRKQIEARASGIAMRSIAIHMLATYLLEAIEAGKTVEISIDGEPLDPSQLN